MKWPLDKFWISQGFHDAHKALDLATYGATQGDAIKAPESGRIDAVNNEAAAYFGGKYVVLIGDSGHRHYMGHNRDNYVKVGQRVTEGQHIADVGMTGRADGPHIHYQVSINGAEVDPTPLFVKAKSKEEAKMVQNNTRHFHVLRQTFFDMTGRFLSKKEFEISCVGRNWDDVLVTFQGSQETTAYRKLAEKGKATVAPASKPTTLAPGVYEVK